MEKQRLTMQGNTCTPTIQVWAFYVMREISRDVSFIT